MTYDSSVSGKALVFNLLYLPCVPMLAWLNLPAEQILVLAILLGIDFLTGLIKVYVLKGSMRSYRAIAGILTKGSVLVLVLSLALMAKGLEMDFKFYLSVFVSVLILSETYSIFGNVYSIKTREEIEEFDAVALAIKRVRVTIEKVLILKRNEL